jgi:glycosyltransferase involved in cell wall biosynthesis
MLTEQLVPKRFSMHTVSLIVPVYNKAPYLKECIASLLGQTLTSCEFIFVNDGSTDGSAAILDALPKEDSRIVIVHQENKGVSVARNIGISLAKGTYIGFVDADDVITSDFAEQLYTTAITTGACIVLSTYYTEFLGKKIFQSQFFPIDQIFPRDFIQDTLIPFVIQNNSLNSVCIKLFSTALLKSNSISFPEGILTGEDGLFTIQALHQAESIIFTDYVGYYYREVAGSTVRSSSSLDYFDLALQHFHFDYEAAYGIVIPSAQLHRLKSIQLLDTVLSLTHIYQHTAICNRKQYIQKMISHTYVHHALSHYWDDICKGKGNYQKFILHCIKIKSVFLLSLAIWYSDFRNPKKAV